MNVPALKAHPTVGVPLALRLAAGDGVGVGGEAVLAAADGVPSLNRALGSGATGGGGARVLLPGGQDRRVGVPTGGAAAVDGAGVGDEAADALADGVALHIRLFCPPRLAVFTWPLTIQLVFSPQGLGLQGLPGFCRFLLYLADRTA